MEHFEHQHPSNVRIGNVARVAYYELICYKIRTQTFQIIPHRAIIHASVSTRAVNIFTKRDESSMNYLEQ